MFKKLSIGANIFTYELERYIPDFDFSRLWNPKLTCWAWCWCNCCKLCKADCPPFPLPPPIWCPKWFNRNGLWLAHGTPFTAAAAAAGKYRCTTLAALKLSQSKLFTLSALWLLLLLLDTSVDPFWLWWSDWLWLWWLFNDKFITLFSSFSLCSMAFLWRPRMAAMVKDLPTSKDVVTSEVVSWWWVIGWLGCDDAWWRWLLAELWSERKWESGFAWYFDGFWIILIQRKRWSYIRFLLITLALLTYLNRKNFSNLKCRKNIVNSRCMYILSRV